jgi:hypothetical protein
MIKKRMIFYYIFLLYSIASVICAINDINVIIADKVIANISVLYIILYTALITMESKENR